MKTELTRRTLLRGTGVAMALPFLESLNVPAFAGTTAAAPPRRMVFLAMGFGVTKEAWYPDVEDTDTGYVLPEGLKPLERHKRDFSVIQNLMHQHSDQGHWGSTFWLTGANRYAVPGSNFHNTRSVDQIAAEALGQDTRYTSLQLEFDMSSGALDGHGPGGLSWDKQGKPLQGLDDPLRLFHKLFSDDGTSLEQKKVLLRQKKSSLDVVLENARSVRRRASTADNEKLEEYFQSVREIELQLAKREQWMSRPKPEPPLEEPEEFLEGYEEIKMMYDLIVAALQTDSTRVITYRQPITALLESLGVRITAHPMSHYNQGERMEASQKRDQAQSELLAGLLDKMKQIEEADGSTLLDNTVLSLGSNISYIHHLTNCPTLVAGYGGGTLRQGQHIVLPTKDTPLNNLWLTELHAIGIEQNSFGDSSGLVEPLLA